MFVSRTIVSRPHVTAVSCSDARKRENARGEVDEEIPRRAEGSPSKARYAKGDKLRHSGHIHRWPTRSLLPEVLVENNLVRNLHNFFYPHKVPQGAASP